ncbi:MAG TPA: hypothetical protein VGM21_14415 [Actinomycetota bacterium]|jgi:hypothetical protein
MSPSTELVPVGPPRRPRRPRAAWRALLRLARSQQTRRALLTALLSAAAGGLIGLSYATADADLARARPRPAAVAPPAAGDLGGERPAPRRTGPVPARRRPPGPETVAAGWYAERLGVPAGKVRALGSQRLGPGRLRVLVLAEGRHGQPTAWIPLRHRHGSWTVGR